MNDNNMFAVLAIPLTVIAVLLGVQVAVNVFMMFAAMGAGG